MTHSPPPRSMPVRIRAAGGVAAAARRVSDLQGDPHALLDADAQPIALRALVAEAAPQVSRMASRFSQLAALGAADCLRRLGGPLAAETRVYLATGLGDVAHTDALYYGVMPPQGEMPPPARFATSGNNMAAFFVAQHAGLSSRNLTLACAELSFECALEIALADLAHGATHSALVGGVDETTLPREFYTRRFHVEPHHAIGEGSGWLVLDNSAEGAAGTVLGVLLGAQIVARPKEHGCDAWVDQIREMVESLVAYAGRSGELTLLIGTSVAILERDALLAAVRERWPGSDRLDYLKRTGRFPTAAAAGIAALLRGGDQSARPGKLFVHVNRDCAGRTGVIVFEAA